MNTAATTTEQPIALPLSTQRKPQQINHRQGKETMTLTKDIKIVDQTKVELFLGAHPQLANRLPEIIEKVQSYFQGKQLELEVVHDYEIPGWETLTLSVCTTAEDFRLAEKTLDRFDIEVLCETDPEVTIGLCVTLKFIDKQSID